MASTYQIQGPLPSGKAEPDPFACFTWSALNAFAGDACRLAFMFTPHFCATFYSGLWANGKRRCRDELRPGR